MNAKHSFKVGDWVKEDWGSSPFFGTPFQITAIDGDNIMYDRPNSIGSQAKNFSLASEEEIKDHLFNRQICNNHKKRFDRVL